MSPPQPFRPAGLPGDEKEQDGAHTPPAQSAHPELDAPPQKKLRSGDAGGLQGLEHVQHKEMPFSTNAVLAPVAVAASGSSLQPAEASAQSAHQATSEPATSQRHIALPSTQTAAGAPAAAGAEAEAGTSAGAGVMSGQQGAAAEFGLAIQADLQTDQSGTGSVPGIGIDMDAQADQQMAQGGGEGVAGIGIQMDADLESNLRVKPDSNNTWIVEERTDSGEIEVLGVFEDEFSANRAYNAYAAAFGENCPILPEGFPPEAVGPHFEA